MNRILGAARLQVMHPLVAVGIPWLVVGTSFAINLAVWGLGDLGDEPGGTGGLASLYITVLIVYVNAVTQVFPFAMGLSVSRRTFYLGTALVAVVQSLVFGVVLTVLTAVENVSNGWGLGLHFWAPGALDVGNPALQVLVFAVPMVAAYFIGIAIGVVFKRWGFLGLYTLALGALVLAGLLVVLITWRQAWTDLWGWLTDRSIESVTIGLPAVLAIALAALTYVGLRRTVP